MCSSCSFVLNQSSAIPALIINKLLVGISNPGLYLNAAIKYKRTKQIKIETAIPVI